MSTPDPTSQPDARPSHESDSQETQQRECTACGKMLPLTEYQSDRSRKSGLSHRCKACDRARSRVRSRRRDPTKHALADKAYRQRNPEKVAQKLRRAYARDAHPEKRRAWRLVKQAVRSGELVSPSACEDCGGEGRVEAHHEDYQRPLDVIWLCRSCHLNRHGKKLRLPYE